MLKKYEIETKDVAVFKTEKGYLFKENNITCINLSNNQITKIENLNENLKELWLNNNPVKEITKKAYNLIKRNKIKVFGVDIDKLKIVENEK